MILDAVFYVLDTALWLYWLAVFIAVIVQILLQLRVLDTRNQFVWSVSEFLYRATEPAFRRVRRWLPNLGPFDLSPLIILVLVTAARMLLGAIQGYMIRGGLYF
jgi:YggT family protein